MSDMTLVDINYVEDLEEQLFYTQNQLELAQKEIAKLNERLYQYETNDKAKKGSK
jgi:hypothetical protein